jgi:RNA polymerase sigma-70 factor (ECF subfamily)
MRTPLRLVTPDDDPASPAGTPANASTSASAGVPDVALEPPAEPADPHAWSTGALVAAAREGDVTAFRILVERYYARCLRFARNMGLDAEDAEEAVQDALVRVHGALDRFAPGAAFEPWLFRILANRCRSTRARGRWWRRIQVDPSPRGGHADVESIPAPAEPDADWRDIVARALETLPAEQREAFLLRHVEGMEYHDMMAVTGVGLSALKMRVKRASDALRARLKELV